MKKIVCVLLVCILLLGLSVYESQDNTIVIYSALEQYRNDELKRQLDDKFPNYNVQIMYQPTAKVGAKIKSEGVNSDADILLGIETGYLDMVSDSLAQVTDFSRLNYLDNLNPESGKYLVFEKFGGGFAVNTQILEKYGLEEPTTYEDLLKPEYKNLIATQDPKSSSTGYNFYLSLYNMWGLEKTLAYYDALNENIKQYSESGSGPVKLLIQGECAVGTALTYQVVNEINNGNPLKMVFPPEGSPYSCSALAMIKGRENNSRIAEVFRYIANEFILYDVQYFNPTPILKNQNTDIPNYPENIIDADMTGLENLNLKKELLDEWKY